MKWNWAAHLATVCSCFLAFVAAEGGEDLPRSREAETRADRFGSGRWELENLIGAYFLFDRGGNERITVDYALNNTRLGIMLYDPCGPGVLRGNVEVLGEIFVGPIFHGPGDIAAGFTAFVRYNFVRPGARIVPYFAGGAGGIYTDIPEGPASANAIGQSVNFNLQAIGGLRFLLNSRWSLNAEAVYRHISNAGMSDPNYGIDQLGGAVGVGFSF